MFSFQDVGSDELDVDSFESDEDQKENGTDI